MKSYSITFKTNNLIIPLNYHYQLQCMIYSAIRDGGCNELHDINDKEKNFKFFTFSLLSGGKYNDKKLYFDKKMYLTVRILDERVSECFEKGIRESLELYKQKIEVDKIESKNISFYSNKYLIKTLSPINVDRTVDGIRISYPPSNLKYNDLINQNLKDKFKSYYGEYVEDDISIKGVGNNKKYITLYKKDPDIYITGYTGYFILEGNSKYIEFLYYCGIGSRNSSGFGAFEIVEVDC